jgi:hypothetical protein
MPTYKQKYNKKYGYKLNEDHSLSEISKKTGYKLSGLKTIQEKGEGAFYSNPKSVRPQVKSATQWGVARVYAAIDPSSKAHKIDKVHLVKKK